MGLPCAVDKTPASLSCGRFHDRETERFLGDRSGAEPRHGAGPLQQDTGSLGRAHRAAARAGLLCVRVRLPGTVRQPWPYLSARCPDWRTTAVRSPAACPERPPVAGQSGLGPCPSVPACTAGRHCGRAGVGSPACAALRPGRRAGAYRPAPLSRSGEWGLMSSRGVPSSMST